MTYVVNDNCIRCKYMDCVEVCPVDCFYVGENMLVIHPDECIDCGVCEPECPVDAILPGYRAGHRQMGRNQPAVCGTMAEHHPKGGASGRRRQLQGHARQVREVLQPQAGQSISY